MGGSYVGVNCGVGVAVGRVGLGVGDVVEVQVGMVESETAADVGVASSGAVVAVGTAVAGVSSWLSMPVVSR